MELTINQSAKKGISSEMIRVH